ncbi:hypothetical protein CR956_01120 [Candidatus Saccharibacteria bacterium]|nr:MAG: hypothetical protein CR956_01120 [Candidatus Saccharibacteria bacterium]
MTQIAPCLTTENIDTYNSLVEKYSPFAKRVHIDISDGEFAPTLLLDPEQLTWPGNWQVDIHAMVKRPSEYIDKLIALKPHTIIFHVEAEEDLVPHIQKLKSVGIKAGVALLKKTVPKTHAEIIEQADHVLIFCGELGRYGGEADLMQLEKIRLVRGIHPEVEIGWDGGASPENAFSLSQGSVNVINVGGAISKASDPVAVYEKMVSEADKQGVI